jgi:hypothetical protein
MTLFISWCARLSSVKPDEKWGTDVSVPHLISYDTGYYCPSPKIYFYPNALSVTSFNVLRQKVGSAYRATRAAMSTGAASPRKSIAPIKLTFRQATGEVRPHLVQNIHQASSPSEPSKPVSSISPPHLGQMPDAIAGLTFDLASMLFSALAISFDGSPTSSRASLRCSVTMWGSDRGFLLTWRALARTNDEENLAMTDPPSCSKPA